MNAAGAQGSKPSGPTAIRSWARDGRQLVSTLTVDDRPVIQATATAEDQPQATLGGHLNYYAHRQFPAPEGGAAAIDELIELLLPFVAELYEASIDEVEFSFPDGHPGAALAPRQPFEAPFLLYRKATFTYSMGRRVIDYRNEE